MDYYADFILTREHARRLDRFHVETCDRWLNELRYSTLFCDDVTQTLRQTHGKNGTPELTAIQEAL